jgi:hypothetical protein
MMKKRIIAAAIAAAAFAAPQAVATTNLAFNGSFESFDYPWGWTWFGDMSWSGYTSGSSDGFGNPINAYATDGTYYMMFGPIEVGGIGQALGTTGVAYDVSFDLANANWWEDGPVPDDVQTSAVLGFGGVSQAIDAPVHQPANTPDFGPQDYQAAWRHYSYTITALDDSGISFAFHSPLAFFYLDNVSVTVSAEQPLPPAVPEPESWALMLAGFGAIGVAVRRQRRVDAHRLSATP